LADLHQAALRADPTLTGRPAQNTREKQSIVMLETALQMARSLGPEGAGGNAALGAWLGEKYEGTSATPAKRFFPLPLPAC
jgi:hypothetical protein